jgi:chemotaxis protein CheY-P-specific phosphatase CheC
MSPPELSKTELDALYELSSVGASHAARAFTATLGCEVSAGAPSILRTAEEYPDGGWPTGVIFESDGELCGLVAILLPRGSREVLAMSLMVENLTGDREEAFASALRELGNIVASHTISAIADLLGSRILLSVPTLVMDRADFELAELLDQRGASYWIESELTSADASVKARLLLIPEAKS